MKTDLYETLGCSHVEAPLCLVDLWDHPETIQIDDVPDAKNAIYLFASLMRERSVFKDRAKDLLEDWLKSTSPTTAQLGINLDSTVDTIYSKKDHITCKNIQECKAAVKHCDKNFCDFPGLRYRQQESHNILVEDVCEISQRQDGSQGTKFSPDMAAAALLREFSIVSTPDERIWIYRDGIYTPRGDIVIDQVLDRLVGDLYTRRAATELHRKVVLRTLKDYSIFDANPYLFCVKNGVVNMKSGKFLAHSAEFYLTTKAPIAFEPSAQCPEIEKFLGGALATEDNVLSFLDILTAKTTDLLFEYFVAMIGGGSNGKTIAEELIRAFFGDDAIAEVDLLTLTQNRFDRAEIFKKKFLINSEVSGDAKESRWIKYISGGGRIDADQKGKAHIQFRPRCLIVFDTNNPPRFADASHAFQRRLVKIDFPNKFVENPEKSNERKRDPFIIRKITDDGELSGLLNILLLRAKDVLPERHIHRRASGAVLANEYEMQANSVTEFFEQFITYDQEVYSAKSDIYDKYTEFCRLINAVPRSKTAVNKYASKTLRLEEKRKEVFGKGYTRVYWGVEIDLEAFEEFRASCRILTGNLPENTISGPSLPTLPYFKKIVTRIVCSNMVEQVEEKTPVNSVKPGPDIEKSGSIVTGFSGQSISEQSIEDELHSIEYRNKIKDLKFRTPIKGHTYTSDGRDLDELGEWQDCDKCGLPLPPSRQNEKNGIYYCNECMNGDE